MADFAEWVIAAEPALPWTQDSFMCTYMNNRQTAAGASLESSSLATALQSFMARRNDWTGTASELLGALEICVENHIARSRNWPQSDRAVSGKLREIAPLLRAINYKLEFHRQAGTGQRLISISR